MLYSILLKLKAADGTSSPAVKGYHAYALFLNIMRQADPDLAARLHDGDGPKPFTVAPAPTHAPPTGAICCLRLTILEDQVFSTLLDRVVRPPVDNRLFVEATAVTIEEVITVPRAAPGVDCSSFQTICDGAALDRRIGLRFLSPTTYRSRGRRNVLFPEPALVFGSLLIRWNALADPIQKLHLTEDSLAAVNIFSHRLQTRVMDFGSYQETGFLGTCIFELDDHLPDEAVRTLNALADFAFYAGTGAKTTMGMGQTRRTNARPLPGGAGSHPAQGG